MQYLLNVFDCVRVCPSACVYAIVCAFPIVCVEKRGKLHGKRTKSNQKCAEKCLKTKCEIHTQMQQAVFTYFALALSWNIYGCVCACVCGVGESEGEKERARGCYTNRIKFFYLPSPFRTSICENY